MPLPESEFPPPFALFAPLPFAPPLPPLPFALFPPPISRSLALPPP